MGGELAAVLALAACVLVIAAVALGLVGWRRFGGQRRPAADGGGEPPPRVAPGERPGPLGQALRRDAATGRRDALLRRLDRDLPEWPASSTLIEAVRDLFALEAGLDAARAAGLPDAITSHLAEDARDTSELLWRRAERLAAAGASGIDSPRLREDMAREDEHLLRLRASIREARAGLTELTLAGDELPDALRRAEGRFRALAAAARELHEFDRDRMP
jgi:hypothetical protein